MCDRIENSGRNRIAMIWPEPELEPDYHPKKSGRIRPDWPDLAGFDKISMLDFEIFQLWPMFSLSTIKQQCNCT